MFVDADFTVLNRDTLPSDGNTYEFEGVRYQDTQISFIWVDMQPGGSVRLHKHPYNEIFITQEGTGTFTVGTRTLESHPGQIIIVTAHLPHKFANTGDQPLRQIDIHLSPRFITEWLEE